MSLNRTLRACVLAGLVGVFGAAKGQSQDLNSCDTLASPLLNQWKQSESRAVLADKRARDNRGPVYAAFMDTVFDTIDKGRDNLVTGFDMIGLVQKAFNAAQKQHGTEIEQLKVKPALILDRNLRTVIIGPEQMAKGQITKDERVQSIFDAPNDGDYDSGVNVTVRFQKSPGNFVEATIGEHLLTHVPDGLWAHMGAVAGQDGLSDIRVPDIRTLACQ